MTPAPAPVLLLALHYQNEVVHPQGKIRVGIAEASPERVAVIAAIFLHDDGVRALGHDRAGEDTHRLSGCQP